MNGTSTISFTSYYPFSVLLCTHYMTSNKDGMDEATAKSVQKRDQLWRTQGYFNDGPTLSLRVLNYLITSLGNDIGALTCMLFSATTHARFVSVQISACKWQLHDWTNAEAACRTINIARQSTNSSVSWPAITKQPRCTRSASEKSNTKSKTNGNANIVKMQAHKNKILRQLKRPMTAVRAAIFLTRSNLPVIQISKVSPQLT